MRIQNSAMAAGAAMLLMWSATSCATRQFVRNRLDPINARVTQDEAQSAEQNATLDKKIDTVDEDAQREASHAEEVARSADADAKSASDQAGQAQSQAADAGKQATDAQTLANQGLKRVAGVETRVDNLDRYQPISKASVVFPLGSSALSAKAKQEVDQLVQSLGSTTRYMVEVEGYTDTTGPAEYNRALATKRADAVVRYLAVNGKLPLYRIHALGVGEESPVESNATRQGREQNRRVEVRVLAPPDTSNGQPNAASASNGL